MNKNFFRAPMNSRFLQWYLGFPKLKLLFRFFVGHCVTDTDEVRLSLHSFNHQCNLHVFRYELKNEKEFYFWVLSQKDKDGLSHT